MLKALDSEGKDIYAEKTGQIACCRVCNKNVRAKCGEINIYHWSHLEKCNDDWVYEGISEWHLNWQNTFPIEEREVIITRNGEKHRADVFVKNQLVVEFQNSQIDTRQIKAREIFYNKMIWVINAQDFFIQLNSIAFIRKKKNSLGDDYCYIVGNPINCFIQELYGFNISVPEEISNHIVSVIRSYDSYKINFEGLLIHKENIVKIQSILTILKDFTDDNFLKIEWKWLHRRKSWSQSLKPLFFDIGNDFLLKVENLKLSYFNAVLIEKKVFIESLVNY